LTRFAPRLPEVAGELARELRGRASELRILDHLLDAVRVGRSATIVIRGEAGIGKTALLQHLAHHAAPEFHVAEVVGVESEIEFAYAGLHQLCSPMLGKLDAVPPPQRSALIVAFGLCEGEAPDRLLIGLATLSLLAEVAQSRPLLCLIDDAQWLDDASCEVLGFVARRLAAESVAIVFAWRSRRNRDDRNRLPGLPELSVEGVSAADARALLATVVPGRLDERVGDRIIAETGGNPLALLELPRGMSPAELAGGFGLPAANGVAAQMEQHYSRRVRRLPEQTQRLLLLAATDAVGDATTIWRAAAALGIGADAAADATGEQLFEIGAQVRFRHPLVRSAVYRSASAMDRRAAHAALAEALDPATDPDRRAWHRAHAASGPDGEVAHELECSAERAKARGGFAAAAALLERSASMTPEQPTRVERRLAAAEFNLRAGAFDAAMGLLAVADSETSDEFVSARIQWLRGQVASSSDSGSDAPLQLLKAAKRLEPLDPALAHQTYLDAWGAALLAGHLASPGGDVVEVSRAMLATQRPKVVRRPFGKILDGLVVLATESRAAADPILRQALHELLAAEIPDENWLHWGALAQTAAAVVWDFDTWSAVSDRLTDLARGLGALAVLPTSLSALALIATWRGDLQSAAAFAAEHDAITEATGVRIAPYGAMLLAAYRGRTTETLRLAEATIQDAVARGEGLGVDLAHWSAAILNNSLGRYAEALEMAWPASKEPVGLPVSIWMLPERIEAAVRCGQTAAAVEALREFEKFANPGDSDWGCGIEARARAMLSDGETAEGLYRDSIDSLSRTPIRAELARSHLVFGEWLRRENRRLDARGQLRTAHDMFIAMTASGFAERARRELLATGERVRPRREDTRSDLTPQEAHIARLARDGRTNPEIAAELYISVRTVEWHLRKVFTKLGINSRRELKDAMPSRPRSSHLA
jgi:DNA-binding CsgD family transcriptional regulator